MSHPAGRFRLSDRGETVMSRMVAALSLAFALWPGLVSAQPPASGHAPSERGGGLRPTLEATAGATTGGGFVASVSAGVAPASWLMLLVQGESFHEPTRHSTWIADQGYGTSATRGFTTFVLGGEVRVIAPGARRVVPYVALGIGAGTWQSNVDEYFSRRDRGPIVTGQAGGGVRIPLRRHLSLVADARFALGVSSDSVIGYVPIRGGVAWDF